MMGVEQPKLSRRAFLKLSALAAAALGAGSPTIVRAATPPFKKVKKRWVLGEVGGKTEIVKAKVAASICPYCSMGCSIDVYTVEDRVIHTRGSTDSYINWGRLCPKGKAAYQLADNDIRVLKPMIRTGPKPPVEEILSAKSWDEMVSIVNKYPPKWMPVEWDEAFRFIAGRMKAIMDEYRAASGAPVFDDGYYYKGAETPVQMIGYSVMTNEASYLSKKIAVFVGTNNLDSQYRKSTAPQ